MSWVKIDDRAWSHPKMIGLSGNAARLWMFALGWCNNQETDGHVPEAALRLLCGTKKDAVELVKLGLWEESGDGWDFHDYLDYQPSAEENRKQREAKSQAGRSGGLRSATSKAQAKLKQVLDQSLESASEVVQAELKPVPNPSRPEPVPVPFVVTPPPAARKPRAPKDPSRWRRVPESWEPSESHRELAVEVGVMFTSELAKFRDWEFRDPKSDADAAFRNWLRNAAGKSQVRSHAPVFDPMERVRILRAEQDKLDALEAQGEQS